MSEDTKFMLRAIELALLAEREGNLPVGAVISLHGEVVAEG
jgi:tRNA(adenine34) deaminase